MLQLRRVVSIATLVASGSLVGACVQFNVPGGASTAHAEKGGGAEEGDGTRKASSEEADADTEAKVLAAADCSKRTAPKKTGYDPLLPQDIPCAVKQHAKLYVSQVCSAGTSGGSGAMLVPGVVGEAVGLGTTVQDDLRMDVKIKTTSGVEGIVLYDCLSRAPIGVSFLPPKNKPANGEAAIFELMKRMFDEAWPMALEAYDLEKRNDFKSFDSSSEDYFRLNELLRTHDFYARSIHALTYGTGRELAQVLKDESLKWLADWPDEVSTAYADGLKDKAKDKAVPAVDAIQGIVGFGVIARGYDDVRFDEENLDKDVADVPENKRAMVKQKKLAELAQRRKDIDKKLKDWMQKAKQRKNDVRL